MASAGEARSGAGTRSAGAPAERISEKRDNNLYRRELVGVEDKDQQDRRLAQRDVEEEEADGSLAEKRRRDEVAVEDARAEENAGKRDRVGRRGDPYRQRLAEERETRLSDNGRVRRRGRLDRGEEESVAEISARKPAKRREMPQDGNGRRDRHEKKEENLPGARRDRRKVKEDQDKVKETIPSESKKTTTNPLDEEERLPVDASGKVREGATTTVGGRYDPDSAKNWRAAADISGKRTFLK